LARNFWNRRITPVHHSSRALLLAAVGCVCASLAACGDDTGDGPAVNIHSGARLGWDQKAASVEQLRALTYKLYIDQGVSFLRNFSCEPLPGSAGFPCSGELPPMSPGRHSLELTSILSDQESSHSTKLIVNVTTAASVSTMSAGPPSRATDAPSATLASTACVGRGTVCYEVQRAASGLESATALTSARDGALFFVEGERQVRIIDNDVLAVGPALVADTGSRIVGLAVDDRDPTTRFVFVAWTATTRDSQVVVNVTRYRELQHVLGEGAQIVTGLPFKDGAFAPLAIGSDGLLYLALPSSTAAGSAARSTERGLVLRVTRDGFAPPGSAQVSPAYVQGGAWPTSLTAAGSRTVWSAGRAENGSPEIVAITETSAAAAALLLQLPATSQAVRSTGSVPDPVVSLAAANVLMASDGHLFQSVNSDRSPLTFQEIGVEPGSTVLSVVARPDRSMYVSILRPDEQAATILRLRLP